MGDAAPAETAGARQALESAGLLAPLEVGEGEHRFTVHRWTAGALAKLAAPGDRAEAHRRAAYYWRWRVETVSGDLKPVEAVPFTLRSLALHLELQTPQVHIDLHWLAGQLQLLGTKRFREIVVEHVGEDGAVEVLRMLDQASEV